MNKRSSTRPSARTMIVVTLLTMVFIISMNALPAMRAGQNTWEALCGTVQEASFWREQVLPIGLMYALMLLVFPTVYERLIRRRDVQEHRLSWTLNRWLITVGGLVFILGTAVPVVTNLLRGKFYSIDQLAFTTLMWLLYGGLILVFWLRKPSEEWMHGFETGDHRRSLDERYQVVMGKSAVTTLYWTMALLLVVGSFYEILVNRVWPARSLAEAAIVFVLWSVIYRRVDRAI